MKDVLKDGSTDTLTDALKDIILKINIQTCTTAVSVDQDYSGQNINN